VLPEAERAAFEQRCRQFVDAALAATLPATERDFNQRVLSNPLDLSTAAALLGKAGGADPDLRDLQGHRYKAMAARYSEVNGGDPFPRDVFVDLAYRALQSTDRRLKLVTTEELRNPANDGKLLTDSAPALGQMLEYKMVVRFVDNQGQEWWRSRRPRTAGHAASSAAHVVWPERTAVAWRP
jgi:hypothetical protein